MTTQPGLSALAWPTVGLLAAVAALGIVLAAVMHALRRARAARHRAERLLQLLANGAAEHALVELDASGCIVQWNAGAQRLYGYEAAQIVGKHCSCLYTEEERSANAPQKQLELAARHGRHAVGGVRVGKGARRFMTDAVIHALRDPSGRLIGFGCVEHDCSDTLRRQQALEQMGAALAQAQKLAALGRLCDGIAHDFNNIIQVISTCVETLQRGGQEQASEFLQMIKRNTERAAGLSGHLLSLARRSSRAAALTNVNEIVADVVGLLRHTLSEEITLDVRVGDALLWTTVDPNQLEAALLSLAVNARDAVPAGGTLSIGTLEMDGLPALPHSGSGGSSTGRAEHYVVISVAHTGVAADGEGPALQAVRSVLGQSGAVLTSEPRDHGRTAKLYLPRHAG